MQHRTGGPPVAEMLYAADMPRDDFSGAEILLAEDRLAEIHEGRYHTGTSAVVRMVVRRPV